MALIEDEYEANIMNDEEVEDVNNTENKNLTVQMLFTKNMQLREQITSLEHQVEKAKLEGQLELYDKLYTNIINELTERRY